MVDKNAKTPNLSPMADDAITQCGIRGLGSPSFILEFFALYPNSDCLALGYTEPDLCNSEDSLSEMCESGFSVLSGTGFLEIKYCK